MRSPDSTVQCRAPVACWRLGSGRPVLVLHGFPDHGLGLLGLGERIAAAGAEAILPALPGYHPSGPLPDGDYSVGAVSCDMLALADGLGLERFAVVGHDWGGLLAYHLGATHPERIEAIVALSVPHPTGFRLRRRVVREQQSAAYAWILAYAGDAAEMASDAGWLTQLAHTWSPGLVRDDWPAVLDVLTRPEVGRAVAAGTAATSTAWANRRGTSACRPPSSTAARMAASARRSTRARRPASRPGSSGTSWRPSAIGRARGPRRRPG